MEQNESYKDIEEVNTLDEKQLGISKEDKSKLDALDYSDKNIFLQTKIEEIQKQIEQLQKKQEEDKKKIEENNNDIDRIDDELPEIREKIDNKRNELQKKGINLENHDNAFVKEYDILLSLQDNKKDIKNSLQVDNDKTKSSMKEDEGDIKELEKQRTLLEKLHEQNNKERIGEAKDEAKDKVLDANVQTQSNAVLTFMETLFAAAEHHRQLKQAEEHAENRVVKQAQKEDYQASKAVHKDEHPEHYENESPSAKAVSEAKDAVIVMAHTADGKDIIRILDSKEQEQYADKDENINNINAIKAESSLPDDQKLTSIVTLTHPNKEELLKQLEPVAGNAVKFPQDLHEYCSTDDKRLKVTETLFANCKVEDARGGNHFSQFLSAFKQEEKNTITEEQTIQEPSEKSVQKEEAKAEQQPTQDKKYNTESVKKEQQQGWNLFDYIKEKFHLVKEKMRPEDIQHLEAGEPTGLYKLKDGRVARLRPKPDPITNDMSVMVEIRRKSPDYKGIQKTLNLSEADVANLKKFDMLNHPVTYNGKTGLIYKDRDTNNFLFTSTRNLHIDKKLKDQLDVEQVKHLKEGKPVHVDNLKDDKGQKYTGWIYMDPKKRQVLPLKKEPAFFTDKDFEIQVKNNNEGARADVVKDDKDAVLKSGQQHNDDGPMGEPKNKEDEKKEVYKDFSQDETSVTETTTTKHKIG